MASGKAAFNEGYATGSGYVDSVLERTGKRAVANRRAAVLDAAGDAETGATGRSPRTGAGSASEEARELERRTKAAEDFAKALAQETAEIGKNRVELKMMAADRAATEAPTEALAKNIRDAAAAWQQATIAQAVSDLRQELGDLNEQTEFENSLIGMNAEARAVANAEREIELRLRALERQGIDITTEAIQAETDAYIANARARGQREDAASSANAYADHIANLADNLRDAGNAFSDLFGIAGDGFNGLIDTLGTYYEFQAEQEARLAELREGSEEYFRVQAEGAQRMAELETEAYRCAPVRKSSRPVFARCWVIPFLHPSRRRSHDFRDRCSTLTHRNPTICRSGTKNFQRLAATSSFAFQTRMSSRESRL
jgi:hypothetical protein